MSSSQQRAAFERLLVAGYLLLCPPLLALALRRSSNSDVLGLWSWRAFVLLASYTIGMAAMGFVVFHRRTRPVRVWLLIRVRRIRRIRWKYLLALLSAPLLWCGMVAGLIALAVVPTPIIVGCLINAILLAVWANITLVVAGRSKTQQRDLTLKLALAGSTALICIVSIEIVAATTGLGAYATWNINPKQLDVPFRTDDFDVRVITNRQGLRELSDIPPSHPDTFRIIVIGDSMTFGWGAEQSEAYPQVAEAVLRERFGRKNVEVINMGRPGASPHDYLCYLTRYAAKLKPDLIVVGFLIGNDVPIQPPARLNSTLQVQAALDRHLTDADSSLASRVLETSFFVRLAHLALNRSLARRSVSTNRGDEHGRRGPIFFEPNPLNPATLRAEIAALDDSAGAEARSQQLRNDGWIAKGLRWEINPWLLLSIIKHPGGAADALAVRAETATFMKYEWRLCAALLSEMRTKTNELGAEFVVLSIPSAHMVSKRWVDFLADRGCIVTDDMVTSRVINDWMTQWCQENTTFNVDPLSLYRQLNADGEPLYLTTDDHMTPRGYRLLGTSLAAALDERIPDEKPE